MYFILSFIHPSRPQVAPLMDKRVVIHGTSRADMNGKRGVATDFHPMGGPTDRTADRYTVKLDNGEEYMLRPERLRVESEEGTGAGGGARPQKKSEKGGQKNRGRS